MEDCKKRRDQLDCMACCLKITDPLAPVIRQVSAVCWGSARKWHHPKGWPNKSPFGYPPKWRWYKPAPRGWATEHVFTAPLVDRFGRTGCKRINGTCSVLVIAEGAIEIWKLQKCYRACNELPVWK
jgi:hypothetical protein